MRVAECGFDPYERDDGLHGLGPDGRYDPQVPRYNGYLNDKGYAGDNPWHDWANAAQGEGNELASGWAMRHARKPARVRRGGLRDALHDPPRHGFHRRGRRRALVPAPLLHQAALALHRARALQRHVRPPTTCCPSCAREDERADPHPSIASSWTCAVSQTFAREEVREEVIPVYMGLIKQIDDQLGVLFRFLEQRGLFENTMIVFTSDHGDYLGDHWMGEKDLFHEPSVKMPLIVYDPSAEADAARGTACDALVEAIDLAPTFLEALRRRSGEQSHRLEGRSLVPFLRGAAPAQWRRYAISEYDYSMLPVAAKLGVEPRDARLFMIADRRWKLIHAPGFRPMLYDLGSDPNEFRDLGADPACEDERRRLMAALDAWGLRLSQRTTVSEQQIRDRARQVAAPRHPDRRVGRERGSSRAVEQLPGSKDRALRTRPKFRRSVAARGRGRPGGWDAPALKSNHTCDRPASARWSARGAIGVAPQIGDCVREHALESF